MLVSCCVYVDSGRPRLSKTLAVESCQVNRNRENRACSPCVGDFSPFPQSRCPRAALQGVTTLGIPQKRHSREKNMGRLGPRRPETQSSVCVGRGAAWPIMVGSGRVSAAAAPWNSRLASRPYAPKGLPRIEDKQHGARHKHRCRDLLGGDRSCSEDA